MAPPPAVTDTAAAIVITAAAAFTKTSKSRTNWYLIGKFNGELNWINWEGQQI